MKLRKINHDCGSRQIAEGGSVFVIVLLIVFGLISMALYFANSMTLELRAADNRTSGLAADQAIEGAARYVSSTLSLYATNGAMPDLSEYSAEAVPVGNSIKPEENAHFWLIGRDNSGTDNSGNLSTEPHFALVDEDSKLDLNAPWLTNADLLVSNLPNMTYDMASAIIDWKDTNATSSSSSLDYGQAGYLPKHAPFETVGELRLVYGSTKDILVGDDLNQNGVLDANETETAGNGQFDPGAMSYFTVYSRQPNTHSDGTSLTNVTVQADLQALLQDRLGASRANEIINRIFGAAAGGPGGGGPGGGQQTPVTFNSLLQFYMSSGMTADEFGEVYNDITATTNAYTVGRVNVNTASAEVLACLPGMDITTAQQLVNYRESNAIDYNSFAWIVDALGSSSAALTTLAQGDYITAHTYQFSADIAAAGPFGRGYRRVRFVFDITDGTPKIVYRRDLSRLGWALGTQTRETWVTQNTR
jgi:type II secretory pathway component PulK